MKAKHFMLSVFLNICRQLARYVINRFLTSVKKGHSHLELGNVRVVKVWFGLVAVLVGVAVLAVHLIIGTWVFTG
jgi:hypothetical protein